MRCVMSEWKKALYRHLVNVQSPAAGVSSGTTSRSAVSVRMPGPQKSFSSPRCWSVIRPPAAPCTSLGPQLGAALTERGRVVNEVGAQAARERLKEKALHIVDQDHRVWRVDDPLGEVLGQVLFRGQWVGRNRRDTRHRQLFSGHGAEG